MPSDTPSDLPPTRGSRCPICGRPLAPAVKPFCTPRCADIDLGRWLNESYRVPVREEDDEDGDGHSRLVSETDL